MITLSIDTSNNKLVTVGLEINGEKDSLTKDVVRGRSQLVLPVIEELLQKHSLSVNDVTNIHVEIGPGSFTGLRVGVAIANTLGLILQVPINENPVGKLVEPVYS